MSEEKCVSPIEAARQVVARHDAQAKEANFERCGCDDCKVLRPITEIIPVSAHPLRVTIEELVSAAKAFSGEYVVGDVARVADAAKRVISAVNAVDRGSPVSPDRVGGGCWFRRSVTGGEDYVSVNGRAVSQWLGGGRISQRRLHRGLRCGD